MSKLLERAKVKLENAQNDYDKIQKSDAYLDDCCFNLQQAIEFTLKYIVEMNGKEPVPTHDIRAQLNILDNNGVEIPQKDEVRNLSSTINSWVTESRYLDNFTATISDVSAAMSIAQALCDYCEGLVIEIDNEEIEL